MFYINNSNSFVQLSDVATFTVSSNITTKLDDIINSTPDSSISANLYGDLLTLTSASDVKAVYVYDICGALVMTSAESTVDMSGIADGMYIVKVVTADSFASIKIIK